MSVDEQWVLIFLFFVCLFFSSALVLSYSFLFYSVWIKSIEQAFDLSFMTLLASIFFCMLILSTLILNYLCSHIHLHQSEVPIFILSFLNLKTELESLPLSAITQTSAVLDSCAYNSLLTITVQERSKRVPQVYMFQCEDTGVSHMNHQWT